MVWASRRTSILDPRLWQQIIADDGYQWLPAGKHPMPGDIVAYVDMDAGELLHVGRVAYDIKGAVSHEKYFSCLSAVLRAAVRHENVIIVGRGARFLLPRETGLSVRLIAPKRFRIEQVRKMQGLSARQGRGDRPGTPRFHLAAFSPRREPSAPL